jgi:hypothetical protein
VLLAGALDDKVKAAAAIAAKLGALAGTGATSSSNALPEDKPQSTSDKLVAHLPMDLILIVH